MYNYNTPFVKGETDGQPCDCRNTPFLKHGFSSSARVSRRFSDYPMNYPAGKHTYKWQTQSCCSEQNSTIATNSTYICGIFVQKVDQLLHVPVDRVTHAFFYLSRKSPANPEIWSEPLPKKNAMATNHN